MTIIAFYQNWLSPQSWCTRVGIRPSTQVVLGLLLLVACTLFLAEALHLFPSPDEASIERRTVISEMAGAQVASLASGTDDKEIQGFLADLTRRYPEVVSAGVRNSNHVLIAQTRDHDINWIREPSGTNTPSHIHVPLFKNGTPWGQFEICFQPLAAPVPWNDWWHAPKTQTTIFILATLCLLFWIFLSRTLKELDPSTAVPERVQVLLDTMVEGSAVLDHSGSIVMTNQAFALIAFTTPDRLIGQDLASLAWMNGADNTRPDVLPWEVAMKDKLQQRGTMLRLKIGSRQARYLSVNASPILSASGSLEGALVTFSDQTVVEAENERLSQYISILQEGKEDMRDLEQMVEQQKAEVASITRILLDYSARKPQQATSAPDDKASIPSDIEDAAESRHESNPEKGSG
ncbi:MAG TPA: PAS domain-containing protein [Tepidisphaeraceae bacterium]|nr:PAS domain-containing protein [Tepidisphaeraceae bacterium]